MTCFLSIVKLTSLPQVKIDDSAAVKGTALFLVPVISATSYHRRVLRKRQARMRLPSGLMRLVRSPEKGRFWQEYSSWRLAWVLRMG